MSPDRGEAGSGKYVRVGAEASKAADASHTSVSGSQAGACGTGRIYVALKRIGLDALPRASEI